MRLLPRALALLLLTLGAALSSEEEYPELSRDSCAAQTTCGTCRNASSLCHWCKDATCHTRGSPYGCVYGASCYDNDQCQRPTPEFRGYAKPSFAAVLGVGVVGGTLAMCAIAAIVLARDFAKSNEEDEEEDEWEDTGYYALAADESDEEYFRLPRPSAPPSSSAAATKSSAPIAVAEITGGRGWRFRGSSADGPQGRRRRGGRRRGGGGGAARIRRRFAGRVYACTALGCSACLALTLAVGALVLVFAPHAPVVNVCNTQFDWGSIVHSIKRAQVEADFQILVSIYNPNYMDLDIEGGSAILRHKHTEIGQMVFEPFVAVGGYVTDVLLVVEIDAQVWDDLHLGYEFETKALALFMDATVTAAITWHGYKTFPFSFSISNYYIRVSDAAAGDRSVCNCPDPMHATPPQQLLLGSM